MQECPAVICLQETFLKQGDNINIKNYQLFNYTYDSGSRASGGASFLIRNDIPHSKVNIKTNIQAVAIKATLYKAVNMFNIYSNQVMTDENEVKKLVDQLLKPFILLGEFNSHNSLCGGVCVQRHKQKGQNSIKDH